MGWLAKLLGNQGERLAARYLRRQGYRILSRQHSSRRGEIDIVALDAECVVFVEVKTRSSRATGHPAEAVDHVKQKKLTQLALVFLKKHGLLEQRARFDVVAIINPDDGSQVEIEHFQNAFAPVGDGQMFV